MYPLRMLRHSRSKSVEWVAKKLSVTPGAVNHYENGTRKLPEDKVEDVSSIFNVSKEVVTVFADYSYKKKSLDPEQFVRLAQMSGRN